VQRQAFHLLVAALAVALTTCLVLYPDLAFQSALRGLRIWWFVVFPALLPFFIAGQVLMALGVVHFLGVLLERFMRPLFNVPGVGAFVVAMGLASGYPIGAVLTARLVREGQLHPAEGERLMSFCNTADPLFMAGAVAVGFFHDARLAGAIMASHYLAALGTGLALRFHRASERSPDRGAAAPRGLLRRATAELLEARRRDGRPFGQILGDAVRDSVQTLLLVGGLIILFAVVIEVLGRLGVVGAAAGILAVILRPLGVGRRGAVALVSGFFEITIGVKAASEAGGSLLIRLVLANAIIAWSGISVLAQVAAVTQGTGLSLRPYVLARVLHALLAAALTFWFWNPVWLRTATAVPAMAHLTARSHGWSLWISTLARSCSLALLALLVLLACVAATGAFRRARIAWVAVGPRSTRG
jgi:sporulation integral membrane protein YlbJ